MISYQLYIDGAWTGSDGDCLLTVLNPATEEAIGTVPEGTVADVGRVKTALDAVTVGDPADPATTMGPLISAAQRAKVEGLIQAGRDEGAQVAYGSQQEHGSGAPASGTSRARFAMQSQGAPGPAPSMSMRAPRPSRTRCRPKV